MRALPVSLGVGAMIVVLGVGLSKRSPRSGQHTKARHRVFNHWRR